MSILVVGLSHESAPVTTLERAAVSGDTLAKLLLDLAGAEPVAETFVISTCNRVEVYADVDRFHPGVAAISELIGRHGGIPVEELTPHLYVHYEDRAVSHLLAVGAGSMSALAVATARRDGARRLVIANRTRRRAERLATRPGVTAARAIGLTGLPDALTAAEIVICCTGAAGHVITADMMPARRRGSLMILDLRCRGMWSRRWPACPA